MGSHRRAQGREGTTVDQLTGSLSPVQGRKREAGRQEEAQCATDKGQDLSHSCEAHAGGPGACFGPEVTRVFGCGQLGPARRFYSWVLGSITKYGVARGR